MKSMCAYKVKVVKRGRMKISNLYLGRGSAGASLSTPAKLFSTPAELGARIPSKIALRLSRTGCMHVKSTSLRYLIFAILPCCIAITLLKSALSHHRILYLLTEGV